MHRYVGKHRAKAPDRVAELMAEPVAWTWFDRLFIGEETA